MTQVISSVGSFVSAAGSAVGSIASSVGTFAGNLFSGVGEFVGGAGGILGDALQLGSTYLATEDAKRRADAEAAEAAYNSYALRTSADAERRFAKLEVSRMRREELMLSGARQAAAGASGVVANTGSFLDVAYDDAYEAALDREIYIKKSEFAAKAMEDEAGLYDYLGRSVEKSKKKTVLATILQGVTPVVGRRL